MNTTQLTPLAATLPVSQRQPLPSYATVTPTQDKPLRTRPKATCEHFGISTMTLWRWVQQAGFPQPLKRGSVVMYDIEAITAWLADGEEA